MTKVFAMLASAVLLAGAAGSSSAEPPRAGLKVVLVAGDDSIPVFDDATARMAAWLQAHRVPARDIVRLSAARSEVLAGRAEPATLRRVLGAVAAMAPAPGQGCLVFATSHGAPGRGLVLTASEDYLAPRLLAEAVRSGCGAAPAVIVLSGCYSGIYARSALVGPNHVVLTAARADRSSFGCAAGREYTVYDSCLLETIDHAASWRAVSATVRDCIAAEERREDYTPASEPQASLGRDVADAPLPPAGDAP